MLWMKSSKWRGATELGRETPQQAVWECGFPFSQSCHIGGRGRWTVWPDFPFLFLILKVKILVEPILKDVSDVKITEMIPIPRVAQCLTCTKWTWATINCRLNQSIIQQILRGNRKERNSVQTYDFSEPFFSFETLAWPLLAIHTVWPWLSRIPLEGRRDQLVILNTAFAAELMIQESVHPGEASDGHETGCDGLKDVHFFSLPSLCFLCHRSLFMSGSNVA